MHIRTQCGGRSHGAKINIYHTTNVTKIKNYIILWLQLNKKKKEKKPIKMQQEDLFIIYPHWFSNTFSFA